MDVIMDIARTLLWTWIVLGGLAGALVLIVVGSVIHELRRTRGSRLAVRENRRVR
jgi:hypothetical protein